MAASIDINNDAAVLFADKLERMGRSDLPVVINQSLNNAAFDVKKNTMLETSSKFINREKRFFKGTSTVKKSSGFNINQMKAIVGFQGKGKASKLAVSDLEQQEHGGVLDRSFIPNDQARIGGKKTGKVRSENLVSVLKKKTFIDARRAKGSNNKRKFISAAFVAKKTGTDYVLGAYKAKRGGRLLYKITKFQSNIRTRSIEIKSIPLLTVKSGHKAKIDSTKFMSKATKKSASKMLAFFKKNARKRLKL